MGTPFIADPQVRFVQADANGRVVATARQRAAPDAVLARRGEAGVGKVRLGELRQPPNQCRAPIVTTGALATRGFGVLSIRVGVLRRLEAPSIAATVVARVTTVLGTTADAVATTAAPPRVEIGVAVGDGTFSVEGPKTAKGVGPTR